MTYNVFSGTLNPAESKLSAHASPPPKWHLNRFSRLCTDDPAKEKSADGLILLVLAHYSESPLFQRLGLETGLGLG